MVSKYEIAKIESYKFEYKISNLFCSVYRYLADSRFELLEWGFH